MALGGMLDPPITHAASEVRQKIVASGGESNLRGGLT